MTEFAKQPRCAETTYTVGKFYTVPCIKTVKECARGAGEFVPIVGPEHEDKEFINFPWDHWHIDWRFASSQTLKRCTIYRTASHAYSAVIQRWAYQGHAFQYQLVEGEPVMLRRKCKRQWPAYPHDLAKWLPNLQAKFANTKMCGMVCPHRGLPLDGCARDGDIVQCPGHGLRWNVKTGELVT